MAGADDLRPLDAAIDEIRMLHRAAERAAARIGSEAEQIRGRGTGAGGLVAEVADALVERTEAIREDCRRLERLLDRARAAVAADLGAAYRAEGQAPAAHAQPPAPPETHRTVSPPAEPAVERAAPWRFWRRRRGREAEPAVPPLPPPAPLPRPDFLASGVAPVGERREPAPAARQPVPEAVRLIASQMAIAGASRVEVARRLQRQFGIADPEPVLDEIFGSAPTRVE